MNVVNLYGNCNVNPLAYTLYTQNTNIKLTISFQNNGKISHSTYLQAAVQQVNHSDFHPMTSHSSKLANIAQTGRYPMVIIKYASGLIAYCSHLATKWPFLSHVPWFKFMYTFLNDSGVNWIHFHVILVRYLIIFTPGVLLPSLKHFICYANNILICCTCHFNNIFNLYIFYLTFEAVN